MKKNELVHLHTLLVQVAEEYVKRGDATPGDFEAYNRLSITPLSLRASRADHERAVSTLMGILADRAETVLADEADRRAVAP